MMMTRFMEFHQLVQTLKISVCNLANLNVKASSEIFGIVMMFLEYIMHLDESKVS